MRVINAIEIAAVAGAGITVGDDGVYHASFEGSQGTMVINPDGSKTISGSDSSGDWVAYLNRDGTSSIWLNSDLVGAYYFEPQ